VDRATTRRRTEALIRRCHAGLGPEQLHDEVLTRLRGLMSIDAAFLATVDPATLLFTSATSEAPLDAAASLFLENEFGQPDVNKFAQLAAADGVARSLDDATGHDRGRSPRGREILAPLGLGDELRVALRCGSSTWGVLCLHREAAATGFSDAEAALVASLAPHIAAGLRRGVVLGPSFDDDVAGAAGLVVLDAEAFAITSANVAGERLLADLGASARPGLTRAPILLEAVARRALHERGSDTARARLRSPDGHWLVVEASVLRDGDGGQQVAVVIEHADGRELMSLILAAFELTAREQSVAELVLRGYSTRQIVDELRISRYTVQDHLKAVFAKFGVGSRRELVASVLGAGATRT
jgi:DNA-binding CsgD family transcriptional regulator